MITSLNLILFPRETKINTFETIFFLWEHDSPTNNKWFSNNIFTTKIKCSFIHNLFLNYAMIATLTLKLLWHDQQIQTLTSYTFAYHRNNPLICQEFSSEFACTADLIGQGSPPWGVPLSFFSQFFLAPPPLPLPNYITVQATSESLQAAIINNGSILHWNWTVHSDYYFVDLGNKYTSKTSVIFSSFTTSVPSRLMFTLSLNHFTMNQKEKWTEKIAFLSF